MGVRQRLQKGKVFTTLIFCLLESLIYLPISLTLLETGQRNSRFLFLLSKLEKGIWISLSPLKCGEIVFKFLFLFSIGLFCISSMTAPYLIIASMLRLQLIVFCVQCGENLLKHLT